MKLNYVNIQGWMYEIGCNDLKEIVAYAVIFGFSQDGESKFEGSLQYVMKILQCSKPTAIATLKSLEDKGLINKEQEVKQGVTFNKYSAILPVVKNLYCPGKETLPNNNIDNNTPITLSNDKDISPVPVDDEFEKAWALYGKKGNKSSARSYWLKLSKRDREAIIETIPIYLAAKPDEKFRKDFSGWINPTYRRWEDKIIFEDSQRPKSNVVVV